MNTENNLKIINLKQDRNFFLLILLFGSILNLYAMVLNDGKMPVKTNISFKEEYHFGYNDLSKIRGWILTDIFNIKNKFVFSIGDVFVGVGIVGLIIKDIQIIKQGHLS